MRLLLYEWCCSGGIQSELAHDILQEVSIEDFLREGRLMLEALTSDAEQNTDLDITVMVEPTISSHYGRRGRPDHPDSTRNSWRSASDHQLCRASRLRKQTD